MSGSSFFASVGALTASRAVLVVSQLAILPVMARFLTAADFGAFALAMSVVVFAQVLSDAGLGRSLIRQRELDDLEWSSVFWILTGVGAGLAAILLLTSPLWAMILDLPRVQYLVSALAVVPFLSAITAVPNARLERDRHFPMLAVIRTTAALLGLSTAVALAMNGAGSWALVGQQVVIALVQFIGGTFFSSFRPSWRFAKSGLRKHIIFARDTIGASLLFTAERQAPVVLSGYFLGAAPLGLFEMSRRLLNFPQIGLAGPASQVIYVRMARALPDLEEVGKIYVATIRLFALVIIPPMVILGVSGHVIFPAVLSERWAPVAGIFILAVAGYALEAVNSSSGTAFQASGRTTLRLRMQVEYTALRIAAIAIAAPFGIRAVAIMISVVVVAYLPRNWQFVRRAVPFDRLDAAKAILTSTVVSCVGAIGFNLIAARSDIGNWTFLGASGVVLLLVWLVCAGIQYSDLRRDIGLLKK